MPAHISISLPVPSVSKEKYCELTGLDRDTVDKMLAETFAPGVPQDATITERKLWFVNAPDYAWRSQYLHEIPDWLAGYFGQRYEKIFNGSDGRRRANAFLRRNIGQNVLPRLRKVTARYALASDALDLPSGKDLNRLPSLDRPELKKLAGRVASWLSQAFCDFIETLSGRTCHREHSRAFPA